MNVIAGIVMGIANNAWIGRLAAPFLWGLVYCVYVSVRSPERREAFIANARERGRALRWGMSPTLAFYFVEYCTATATSLTFSVISGLIKGLF